MSEAALSKLELIQWGNRRTQFAPDSCWCAFQVMFKVSKFPCGAANDLNVFSISPYTNKHLGAFITPLHEGKKTLDQNRFNMNILFLVCALAQHWYTCVGQRAPALHSSLLESWPSAFVWGLTFQFNYLVEALFTLHVCCLGHRDRCTMFFFFVCCASAASPPQSLSGSWSQIWRTSVLKFLQ